MHPGDEIPLAITVMGGEGLCLDHLTPPTIYPGDPVIERLARHLRKNYVPGTTNVRWEEAEEEERSVWMTEAAHFLEVATLEAIGWTVQPATNVVVPVGVSPNHPSVVRLPGCEGVTGCAEDIVCPHDPPCLLPGSFQEHGNPGDDKVYTELTGLPAKWSTQRSD